MGSPIGQYSENVYCINMLLCCVHYLDYMLTIRWLGDKKRGKELYTDAGWGNCLNYFTCMESSCLFFRPEDPLASTSWIEFSSTVNIVYHHTPFWISPCLYYVLVCQLWPVKDTSYTASLAILTNNLFSSSGVTKLRDVTKYACFIGAE